MRSAAPLSLEDATERLPPVQSVRGTSAEVAWLPIAFAADVHMSVGKAEPTPAPAR